MIIISIYDKVKIVITDSTWVLLSLITYWHQPDAVSLFFAVRKDCPEEEFNCQSNKECVPGLWVCDGEADCEDKSDEWFCGKNLRSYCTFRPRPQRISQNIYNSITNNCSQLHI